MNFKVSIIISVITGCLLFYSTDDLYVRLAIIIITELLTLTYFRFNLNYPYVWLSPFLIMYNVSVIILSILDIRHSNFSSEILSCTYVALLTSFLFCILFIKVHKGKTFNSNNASRKSLTRIFTFLSIGLLLYVPFFISSGYTSKQETNLHGGLAGYGIVSQGFLFFYTALSLLLSSKGQFPLKQSIITGGIGLVISLVLGERDIFLAVLLLTLLGYNYYNKISNKKIILFSICVILMIPILSATKQITNQKQISFSEINLVEGILSGEFISSGRNLETLIKNRNSWNYKYGESLIDDIARAIIPRHVSLMQNTTGWFNSRFNERQAQGFGYGFSYIGEGYLQAGIIGIIVWMVFLFIMIKILYDWSQKGILSLTVYFFMIPLFIYAMRGDISYILSPLFKQAIPLYLISTLFCKNHPFKTYKTNNDESIFSSRTPHSNV